MTKGNLQNDLNKLASALSRMPETKTILLRVIDGHPATKVKFTPKEKQPEKMCAGDKHCASHGSGPYFCCKCGASFDIAD